MDNLLQSIQEQIVEKRKKLEELALLDLTVEEKEIEKAKILSEIEALQQELFAERLKKYEEELKKRKRKSQKKSFYATPIKKEEQKIEEQEAETNEPPPDYEEQDFEKKENKQSEIPEELTQITSELKSKLRRASPPPNARRRERGNENAYKKFRYTSEPIKNPWKFSDLKKEALKIFQEKHPEKAEEFAKKVFNNPMNDPLYREMKSAPYEWANEEVQKRGYEPEKITNGLLMQIQKDRSFRQFVQDHPEKAQAYRQYDEELEKFLTLQEKIKREWENPDNQIVPPTIQPPQIKITTGQTENNDFSYSTEMKPSDERNSYIYEGQEIDIDNNQDQLQQAQLQNNILENRTRPPATRRELSSKMINRLNGKARQIRQAKQAAKMASQVGKTAAKPFLIYIIIAALILIIIIAIILAVSGFGNKNGGGSGSETPPPPGQIIVPKIPGLEIGKTGPNAIPDNNQDIVYSIIVTYSGKEDITIQDDIPSNTEFINATGNFLSNRSGDKVNKVLWRLNDNITPEQENSTAKSFTFQLIVHPTMNNIIVTNKAYAELNIVPSDVSGLVPPISGESETADSKQKAAIDAINNSKDRDLLISVYKEASSATGVPWQVFAGIHYREGSNNPNQGLPNGVPIGTAEPTIPFNTCRSNSGNTPGTPIPVPGGCGFRTLLDSAIWAGNHLRFKNGDRIPSDYKELVGALAGYNGWGNSNCTTRVSTPYRAAGNCPALYPGEDHNYVMSYYDKKHESMYIIYCMNGIVCPIPETRPGAMAIILGIAKYLNL